MNAVLENAKTVLSELTALHEEGWCACQSSTLPARVQAALGDLIAALSSPPADDVREALALTIAKTFPGWSEDTSEPVHVGWSEALRLHAEQHNERVNEECIRQGRALADAILAAFEVRPRGMVTPPADDVREALAAIVKQVSQKFAGPSLAEFANDPPLRKHYATADAILATFPALSPPPADDVREALEVDAVVATMTRLRGTTAWWASPDLARAILAAIVEVRPYGTVTDAEKDAAHAEFCGCALRDKCEYWHASGLAIEAARAASS